MPFSSARWRGVTAVVGGGAGELLQWRQEVLKLQAVLAAQQQQLEEASLTAAHLSGPTARNHRPRNRRPCRQETAIATHQHQH